MSSLYVSVRSLGGDHKSKAVKRALDALPGVTSVSVSQSDRCIAVDYDPTGTDREQLCRKLTELGFEVDQVRDQFR